MLSYCQKCKKILRALIQKSQQLAMVKQSYYQSLLYLKNQNLLKNKKQKDY